MSKILLNNLPLTVSEENLPALIHGKDKSGASMYTITLAANLSEQGSKILFLCGYSMAQEEFEKQVGKENSNAKFYTQEIVEEFKQLFVNPEDIKDKVIVVKNAELFGADVFDLVLPNNRIIISGDIEQCVGKEKILQKSFATRVLFSSLPNSDVPVLEKYQAYFQAGDVVGITTLAAS